MSLKSTNVSASLFVACIRLNMFFYRYLIIMIFVSRKHKYVGGLSKPDSSIALRGISQENVYIISQSVADKERNFHDFGPGEMMK